MFRLRQRPHPRPAVQAALAPRETLPLPEPVAELPQIIEGNGEADWALWEASVTALDRHMQLLAQQAAAQPAGTGPA